MAYTISDVKTDLQGIFHGTSLDKVTGVLPIINRAARQVLLDTDPAETRRSATLTNALYDKVYDYVAPSDLKGDKILDIRPQVDRTESDNFLKTSSTQFDKLKASDTFQVKSDKGVKTLRISKSLTSGLLLHDMNSLTANGTWAASGVATDISADTQNYVTGSASLKFNASGAGSATLTNTAFTAVDLSLYEDVSSLFLWVYFDSPSSVTNVILRWGDDASNYWTRTVTTDHVSASFSSGWNLLRFDWNGATETGTPSSASVNYSLVTVTVTAATNNYRVDNLISILGKPYEVDYYSKYLFQDGTTSEWKEKAEVDADIVNLDVDSYNLLLFKSAEYAAQQIQSESFDVNYFATQYEKSKNKYKNVYPSENKSKTVTYYNVRGTYGK